MEFGLTEEQLLLQETLRGFVENECPPVRVRELFDLGSGQDASIWSGLSEMGMAGLLIPESFGGSALGALDLALVCEVLGGGAVPSPLLEHSLAARGLAENGSEAQRSKWLPRMATGSVIGTVAFGEAESLWDPTDWTLRVEQDRLWGSKAFVSYGELADLLLVGIEGGRFALVEREAPGVKMEGLEGLDRTRPLARVEFEGAPCELLVSGGEASGRIRETALAALAADAFGAAAALVDITVDYAKAREQFGQSIAQFQSVKHQIARLGLEIEPTRALWWHAAHAVDHLPDEAVRAPALAKAHIGERAAAVARMAVELHGGLGFTWECDVQIWLKRILFNRTFMGHPEALRERSALLGGMAG